LLNEIAPAVHLETVPRGSLESAGGSVGSQFRLTDHVTPLYARADGWSPVLLQLPAGQVVTLGAIEGHFVRVRAGGVDGYLAAAGREPLYRRRVAAAIALRTGVSRAQCLCHWIRPSAGHARSDARVARPAGPPRARRRRRARTLAYRQSRHRAQHEARRIARR